MNTSLLGVGGGAAAIKMKGALKDGQGRKGACQGSVRPGGLSHLHLPLKLSSSPRSTHVSFFPSLSFSGPYVEQVETHQTDGKDPFWPEMHLHLNDTMA